MCVLHISGKNFDPSVLATVLQLEVYSFYRAGEPRWSSKPNGPKWAESGVKVDVSDAPWSDLHQQTADACAFLDRHFDELLRLRNLGSVEDMRLDFPVDLRIGDDVYAQFEFFPPALVQKAGALGIGLELSIYPTSETAE